MTEHAKGSIAGSLHTVDGKGVVRMESRYDTDVEDLWSALTDPARLARWYGTVVGDDLRVGGEVKVFVPGSGWDGTCRIEECDRPRRLRVTTWEEVGAEQGVLIELRPDGDATVLVLEKSGVPQDVVWAYGSGWQSHLEDLAAHLSGTEDPTWPSGWDDRFEELAVSYRAQPVLPLDG